MNHHPLHGRLAPANHRFRLLLIEDNRERIAWFRTWIPDAIPLTTATSAGRAIGILYRDRGTVYGGILLDHDLVEQALTPDDADLSGSDLVATIVQTISLDVPILIHSMNPGRGLAMAKRLAGAGFEVSRVPFAYLTPERLQAWVAAAEELWSYLHDA